MALGSLYASCRSAKSTIPTYSPENVIGQVGSNPYHPTEIDLFQQPVFKPTRSQAMQLTSQRHVKVFLFRTPIPTTCLALHVVKRMLQDAARPRIPATFLTQTLQAVLLLRTPAIVLLLAPIFSDQAGKQQAEATTDQKQTKQDVLHWRKLAKLLFDHVFW